MPYYKKRTNARRGAGRTRKRPRRVWRKKGTGGLARRVAGISKQLSANTRKIFWEQRIERDIDISPVIVIKIAPYNAQSPGQSWAPTFEASAIDEHKMIWKGSGMDFFFEAAGLQTDCTYTVMLVSLTAQGNDLGANGIDGIVNGVHFSYCDGTAMVNKNYFNIHKIKRFTITTRPLLTQQPSDSVATAQTSWKRFHWKLSFPKGRTLIHRASPVGNLEFHELPYYDRYAILIFNNEGHFLENKVKINMIHSTRIGGTA